MQFRRPSFRATVSARAGLVLGLVWLSIAAAHAQGGGAQTSTSTTRHFAGERFVSVEATPVFDRVGAGARIVRDIPNRRMVYARPSRDPAWFEVLGAGQHPHPYSRQGVLEPVQVEQGKLVLREDIIDRNVYRRISGFVRAAHLRSLDHPAPLPKEMLDSLAPVPSPLAHLGVKESRFIPTQPLAAPFRSMVRVRITGSDPRGYYACSGFVVNTTGLVATSGHCFRDKRDQQTIEVEYGDAASNFANRVVLKARIVYWHDLKGAGGGLADSALLQVDDPRIRELPPLALASSGAWLDAGAVQVMLMGFGLDLEHYKKRWLKVDLVPHVSVCTLPPGQIMIASAGRPQGKREFHVVSADTGCVSGPGDSGGPLVLWNAAAARYEVLALNTWGENIGQSARSLSPEAHALLETIREGQSAYYGVGLTLQAIQGVAALHKQIERTSSTYRSNEGWAMDERLHVEVSKLSGWPPSFPMLWEALMAPAPQMRLDDSVTYRVNNDFLVQGFRDARAALPLPLPAADAKQITETYGHRITAEALRAPGVAWRAFRFGEIQVSARGELVQIGKKLIPEDGYAAYRESLRAPILDLVKRHPSVEDSVVSILQGMDERFMLEVGPDLFVVDAGTLRITEVLRNWMRPK